MAENSVIISAEEEAKLLKPIDEYVEKIQKKIDALRVDGSDKVNDLKNQIAIAKENKNLSRHCMLMKLLLRLSDAFFSLLVMEWVQPQ